ncbi:acetolactate decarboxylase [Enterococcus sp. LJL90]
MQKVKQLGTMQMLAESLLEGFVKNKDILALGNVGIGTGEGIDGELVIWDGVSYKVDGEGNITKLGNEFPIVYANVHKNDFQFLQHFENIALSDIQSDVLKIINSKNIMFSVLIEGEFVFVTTRSAFKSHKPYPGLEEIAKNQINFHKEKVKGRMIGYYTPVLYQGIGVPNYHQHFIADSLDFGGHVIDAKILSANVFVQMFNGIDIELPVSNEAYIKADLAKLDRLTEIIKKAE